MREEERERETETETEREMGEKDRSQRMTKKAGLVSLLSLRHSPPALSLTDTRSLSSFTSLFHIFLSRSSHSHLYVPSHTHL